MARRRRTRDRHIGVCGQESGAAAVEFALVLLPLLVVVFGIIQYGIYFYSAQTGAAVANQAVRRLSVGDCGDLSTELRPFIKTRLASAASPGTLNVSPPTYVAEDGTSSAGPSVGGTVTLHFTYESINLHFPFLPFLSDSTISKTIDARQEDDTPESACS